MVHALVFALPGCSYDADPESTAVFLDRLWAPVGPGDPIRLDLRQSDGRLLANVEPVVLDAQGHAVDLEQVEALDAPYGWAPRDEFPAGDYRVVGATGYDVALDERFTIAPYGVAPIQPATLAGRAWILYAAHTGPVDLSEDLGWPADFAGPTVIAAIEAVEQTTATFALVFRGAQQDCVLLRDTAEVDLAGHRLSWGFDRGTVHWPLDGGGTAPIDISDVSFEVRWLAGDDGEAWGQAGGRLDTRNLASALGWGDDAGAACDKIAKLGLPCGPCDDGVPVCAGGTVFGATLTETDPPGTAELPLCGVDRTLDSARVEPLLACDVDLRDAELGCGCNAGVRAGGPALVALALVLRRRRRG
jgi:hypothetical protein